jgi:prevent-host-death family protein
MKTELVTTLKRQATKILSELHESKEPVLITEHGKPSAYLVDFEDFESLQRRMQILEGIARGESAALEGKTLSHAKAKNQMKKWLS